MSRGSGICEVARLTGACHSAGMQVTELWRYPVKSLQGEPLTSVEATAAGLRGDRAYAILDAVTGLGLTARRVPELLFASALLRDDGAAEITLPNGAVATDDHALSAWLERPVTLRSAKDNVSPRFENVADFEHEATSAWEMFEGGTLAFHDSPDAVVSLVSMATMSGWAPRRFRANVLFEGASEETLVALRVKLGDAVLDVGDRLERCVMVTRPQAEGIDKDLDVLRTIHRRRGGCLAVGAMVASPGTVRVGDELLVV